MIRSKAAADSIDKKKCNLIFFRIPENDSEDTEHRIKHDYDCFTKFFNPKSLIPKILPIYIGLERRIKPTTCCVLTKYGLHKIFKGVNSNNLASKSQLYIQIFGARHV